MPLHFLTWLLTAVLRNMTGAVPNQHCSDKLCSCVNELCESVAVIHNYFCSLPPHSSVYGQLSRLQELHLL